MSLTWSYDSQTDILIVRVQGAIVLDEFSGVMEAIQASETFGMDVATIWDLRDVDFATFDRYQVARAIQAKSRHPERAKACVAVVVSNTLGFGMTRMFQIQADIHGTHPEERFDVFYDVAEATEWIVKMRSHA